MTRHWQRHLSRQCFILAVVGGFLLSLAVIFSVGP